MLSGPRGAPRSLRTLHCAARPRHRLGVMTVIRHKEGGNTCLTTVNRTVTNIFHSLISLFVRISLIDKHKILTKLLNTVGICKKKKSQHFSILSLCWSLQTFFIPCHAQKTLPVCSIKSLVSIKFVKSYSFNYILIFLIKKK